VRLPTGAIDGTAAAPLEAVSVISRSTGVVELLPTERAVHRDRRPAEHATAARQQRPGPGGVTAAPDAT
jgi:hypothetical protein